MTLVQACLQISETSIDRFNELECDVPFPICRMDMLSTLEMRLFQPIATKYQRNKFIKNKGFPISCIFFF